MPHESTVNPYDRMGDTMSHDIMNRISRGSSLLSVDATIPGHDVSKLAQEASVKLTDLADHKKASHSQVTDQNKQLFYGAQVDVNTNEKADNTHASLAKRDSATSEQLTKPETPSELTHHEDLDDDDEESDESKSSIKDN